MTSHREEKKNCPDVVHFNVPRDKFETYGITAVFKMFSTSRNEWPTVLYSLGLKSIKQLCVRDGFVWTVSRDLVSVRLSLKPARLVLGFHVT